MSLSNRFPAYRGDQPYVFVCYSHDDASIVDDLIWLEERGIHCWYDEGIAAGSVWREELADILDRSAGVIFFRSQSSVTSRHCQNEINFALDRSKPIVVVALDEAPMSPGLTLSLGGIQSITASKLTDATRRRMLMDAIALQCKVHGDTGLSSSEKSPSSPIRVLVSRVAITPAGAVAPGALEQLLEIGISKLPYIIAVTPSALGDASALDSDAADTHLSLADSLSLAVKNEIDCVIHMRLNDVNEGYAGDVQLLDSASGDPLMSLDVPLVIPANLASETVRTATRTVINCYGIDADQAIDEEIIGTESLPAAAAYAKARSSTHQGAFERAASYADEAIKHDPEFGMAYVVAATVLENSGNANLAEQRYRQAFRLLDRMDKREKARTMAAYHIFKHNYDQAIPELSALLTEYPYDHFALTNIPLGYFYRRDVQEAVEAAKRTVAVFPNDWLNHANYGIYFMYAGEFTEALTKLSALKAGNPAVTYQIDCCIALCQIALGDTDDAKATYEGLFSGSTNARLVGVLGLSDLQTLLGNPEDARSILLTHKGDFEDSAFLYRYAAACLRCSAGISGPEEEPEPFDCSEADPRSTFLLADAFVRCGAMERANECVERLAKSVVEGDRVNAELLLARIALADGDPMKALDIAKTQAQKLDTWYGRLTMAKAYKAACAYIEALGEFDRCELRKGEALSVTMDEIPSACFLAELSSDREATLSNI